MLVQEALQKYKVSIRRRSWPLGDRVCADVDTGELYKRIKNDNKITKWNPTEDDLMAEDWWAIK